MQKISSDHPTSWLDQPVLSKITLNWETIIFLLILIVTIATRFYDLGARVMSHDENSHVYYSWLLYKGRGYAHDPVTHGPLQFHIVALSYFLFGDSDTTARIPAALFSIATVAFMWNYRRYLGRAGALIAAFMFMISPFMLYYARYVRNEAYVALFGVMTIWAVLGYIDTGKPRYLYWLTAATVLHFTAKETAYIYAAQVLFFLGLYFIYRISAGAWKSPANRNRFVLTLIAGILIFSLGAGLTVVDKKMSEPLSASETAVPAVPGQDLSQSYAAIPPIIPRAALLLGIVVAAGSLVFLVRGVGLENIRSERAFDMLMLQGTLVLPLLSAFAINFLGYTVPDNATKVNALTMAEMIPMGIIIVVISAIAILLGLWWNKRQFLINGLLFYGIFTVLYTTFFTNGAGFVTGLVGSLGYWLAQQGVQRGSQPWYYYLLVQVPIYEFLPAIGSLLALLLIGKGWPWRKFQLAPEKLEVQAEADGESTGATERHALIKDASAEKPPVLALLAFWVITSLVAYSIAGEKMPWLTVHITLPMILLSGLSIGYLVETTDWSYFKQKRGWIVLALVPVFIASLAGVLGSLMGPILPFAGKSLDQLSATSTFLLALGAAVASGIGLAYLIKDWASVSLARLMTLTFLAFLAVLTVRTAFRAAYINYDRATEYLVYAHSGPGVKLALDQIEDISKRLTGGLEAVVAYDNETSYPYWWYLRNYPNQRYYSANPTRDLRDAPLILVGAENYDKIAPIVGQSYYMFDYIRIWWPDQDYFGLTWQRIWYAISNPEMRNAVFQVWFNRDFTEYAQLTGKNLNLSSWPLASRMRLYIRKDVVDKIWNYGVSPTLESASETCTDKTVVLDPDQIIGSAGTEFGQFQNPKDVAVAPDGSLYVADTFNNRIQHFSTDGQVLQAWGIFGDVQQGSAPEGSFNQPWGIAVGPDGSVYVADTWNHRIQKFTPEGGFIKMWGTFGQAETPTAFWGPRDVAIDSQGNVLVTDTGNKRVVIFDSDGNYIDEFGSVGFEPGQFDEPVGIAVDAQDRVYVADTWNQRIQVFAKDGSGHYAPFKNWEYTGWYGQSLDNKPYITVDANGHIFISDPEQARVVEYQTFDQALRCWSEFSNQQDGLLLPTGLAADPQGGLWIADSGNNRILHFTPPEAVSSQETSP